MASFKGRDEREWQIKIDVPLCKLAKSRGIDFVGLTPDPIAKLASDPLLLAEILWLLCESQAGEITVEQFERGLDGASLDAGLNAISEAITEFAPASKRAAVQARLDHNAKIQKESEELTAERLSSQETRIKQAMSARADKEIDRILSDLESLSSANA